MHLYDTVCFIDCTIKMVKFVYDHGATQNGDKWRCTHRARVPCSKRRRSRAFSETTLTYGNATVVECKVAIDVRFARGSPENVTNERHQSTRTSYR
jgi:hypothetical protein